MPTRARMALGGAATGALALVAIWFVTFHVALARRADRSILIGFAGLHRPRIDGLTNLVAGLCSPPQYLVLAAIPMIVVLLRRRPRHAAAMAAIILGANATTQLLKPLLAAPRPLDAGALDFSINAASWPSGHATAAMSLALCAVLAAPTRRRPQVGALMAAFAIAVCYSFLELHWHYPSDVIGGFLVASTWAMAGVAVLFWAEARWPSGQTVTSGSREASSMASVLRPVGAVVLAAACLFVVVVLARPHAVVAYASAHGTLLVGAAVIAAAGLSIAAGASVALNRSR